MLTDKDALLRSHIDLWKRNGECSISSNKETVSVLSSNKDMEINNTNQRAMSEIQI